MPDILTDLTSNVLSRALDAAAARHNAIADNIANAETPGYRRKEVSFEDALKAALSEKAPRSSIERVKELEPKTVSDAISPVAPNGNNVSIDREMTSLTKNGLAYEAMIRLMNIRSGMVETAITEGRK